MWRSPHGDGAREIGGRFSLLAECDLALFENP